jgi:hypothetical protein
VLSNEGKNKFLQIIKNLKSLIGYEYSLKKRVHMDGEMKGMKSHNYHVMMQEIFPLCMQHLMAKGCRMAIIHVFVIFSKSLCQDCGPNYNWRAKERGANDINITRARIPTLIL